MIPPFPMSADTPKDHDAPPSDVEALLRRLAAADRVTMDDACTQRLLERLRRRSRRAVAARFYTRLTAAAALLTALLLPGFFLLQQEEETGRLAKLNHQETQEVSQAENAVPTPAALLCMEDAAEEEDTLADDAADAPTMNGASLPAVAFAETPAFASPIALHTESAEGVGAPSAASDRMNTRTSGKYQARKAAYQTAVNTDTPSLRQNLARALAAEQAAEPETLAALLNDCLSETGEGETVLYRSRGGELLISRGEGTLRVCYRAESGEEQTYELRPGTPLPAPLRALFAEAAAEDSNH